MERMEMKPQILLVATMDTKEKEAMFLYEQLVSLGAAVKIADTGTKGESPGYVAFPNTEICRRGGGDFDTASRTAQRMDMFALISEGLRQIVLDTYHAGDLDGIVALGGSGGMTLAAPAMWALPFGVPKCMVTTVASGNTRPFIRGDDIVLINPVADLIGLNRIIRTVLTRAAGAVMGMIRAKPTVVNETRKAIAMTGFGATELCVNRCRTLLESRGYEVVVFHARGISGGAVMEKLIEERMFCAVLDITTTEIADEIAGGILSAGRDRMEAAVRTSTPYIVVPGAIDIVNLGPKGEVPARFSDRLLVPHSVAATLMRTDAREMAQVADFMIGKLKDAQGAYKVIIPEKGFSAYDSETGPFYDTEADHAFIERVEKNIPSSHIVIQPYHINDPLFAERLVDEMQAMITK